MSTHNEVAHNWMHQTGRHRKGYAVFYEGATIYSWGYHFPIAMKVRAPNGERVILFNSHDYSVSTAKHKTIVRRAIRYDHPNVLDVPLEVSPNFPCPKGMEDIRFILIGELPGIALKWKRARTRKSQYAALLAEKITLINRIAELWQLDVVPVGMPEDIAAFVADHERRQEEERKAKDLKDREAIRKWVNGEDVRPPHTRIPYVRVKMGTQDERRYGYAPVVQTSWGITVPLKEALPIFRLAKLIQKCGTEWVPKKEHKVGGWRLDRIAADGTVRAGCHAIPFKVQMEAARLAGIAAE